MYNNKKIVVVLPAYNAALTLERTYKEIPFDIVDDVILVDDFSNDRTFEVAKKLGIKHIIHHKVNIGYGGNQKTCYNKALDLGADIVVMLHPDYQYTPLLIPAMVSIIASGLYPVVFASRILGNSALAGGMPVYKYFANRFLTFVQNILMHQKLTEYHTGFRAYSGEVLKKVNLDGKENKMPHELSGGEQQRVSIGRALVNDPELILADEPTGNLDPATSEEILILLKNLCDSGRAVLFATHDMLVYNKFRSRTLTFDNAKVTENN